MIVASSILTLYSRVHGSCVHGNELGLRSLGREERRGPEANRRGLDRGSKNAETAESGAAFLFEEMML